MEEQTQTVSFARDEDCPDCGYPETYVEAYFTNPPQPFAQGCRKCSWREEDDDGTA